MTKLPTPRKVFCYRNLNRKGVVYSLKDTKSSLVVARYTHVVLKDVELKVSQAGRARVLRQQKRNVHAGAVGVECCRFLVPKGKRVQVRYNPYEMDSFQTLDGRPVYKARYAILSENGLEIIE